MSKTLYSITDMIGLVSFCLMIGFGIGLVCGIYLANSVLN